MPQGGARGQDLGHLEKKKNFFFWGGGGGGGFLEFLFLQKYLLSSPLRFTRLLSKSLNLTDCRGGKKC